MEQTFVLLQVSYDIGKVDAKNKAKELVQEFYNIISDGMDRNPPEEHMISHTLAPMYWDKAKECAKRELRNISQVINESILYKQKKRDFWKDVDNEIDKL